MPAVNPRITITITPELHAVLRRLSELSGQSQSGIVGELLGESVPVFERMVTVLEAAQKLKAEAERGTEELKAGLIDAHQKLERQMGLMLNDLDEGFRPILEAAEKVDRRASRAADVRGARAGARDARAPAAPMSNRGVTPHHPRGVKGQGKAKPSRRKGGR